MIHKFLKKLLRKTFFLIYVIFALALIGIGLHFNKISKKQYILSRTINEVGNIVLHYANISDQYNFQDDFEIHTTFSSDLTSEEFESKSFEDPKYYQRSNLIKNLSKMKGNLEIKQSKENGKLLARIHEQIEDEIILDGKYYVEDATKYYIVNGIFSNYVNAGNSTYFETLNSENTTKDNIDYLYNLLLTSLENSMYEEEINSYDASISINNETMNVKQISIKLTDGYLKKILERTLKKIKNDPKAKLILSNVYPEFLEIEVDENKEYLKKNENYTFNIYVRKFWYQPIKYELVHILEDDQETYTYEGNKETGVFYYSKNNEAKYTAKVASSEKMIEILVFDSKNTAVGSIKLEKSKNSVSCNTNLNLEERVIDISYSSVYKNYVKNTSYLKEDKLTLRIMNQDTIVLSGNIQIDSNINKKVTINEDIENSILKSTISDEQDDKLKHLKDNVKNRLERE